MKKDKKKNVKIDECAATAVDAEQKTQAESNGAKVPDDEAAEDSKGGWKEFFRFTKDDLKTVIFTVIAALLIVRFVAQPVVVDGHSMDDTLHDGEKLLIEKITRYYGGLDRYDIVVLDPENEEGSLYIKRIVGLPGETIRIDGEGNIYINGEVLKDDVYGTERILDPGRAWEEITLGEDEYFVMGDNRNDSLDSRFEDVGNVNRKQIIGRVIIQMFPFHRVE